MVVSNKMRDDSAHDDWLIGSGEMVSYIRSRDWSETSLGARKNWPKALQFAINMMLSNHFPMVIFWGEQCIPFYNDAYHLVLGRPPRISSLDVSILNESIIKDVMQQGKSIHIKEQLFQVVRDNESREVCFTLSYSPIWMEESNIGGAFVILQEISQQTTIDQEQARKQKLLEDIIDNTPSYIFCFDQYYRFTLINNALADFFGMSKEEILGKTLHDLLPKETADSMLAVNINIMEGGKAFFIEETVPSFVGKKARSIHTSKFPIRDIDKKIIGLWGVATDITDNKNTKEALHQSEAVYRAIGESLNYGIWICDAEGQNIYASQSLLELLGITQKQCSEFGWGNVLHPNDVADTMAAWKECAETGVFWEREHRFKGVDGQWHEILARGVPIRNEQGDIIKWAGINLDISKMKRTEEQLRVAIAARDDFISIASHELRTPLTALHLQLQLLERLAKKELSEHNRFVSVSASAFKAAQQLVQLVEDLLNITHIRIGKMHLNRQKMNLETAVQESVFAVLEEASQHGSQIKIQTEGPVIGEWDFSRIKQILSNLLSNAIKYGKGKPIEISLAVNEQTQCAKLSVQDHGVGIPGDIQAKIFERFERATVDNKISGLGLGLYIVNQLVKAHGGSICVESEPGAGALFVVELPLQRGETACQLA